MGMAHSICTFKSYDKLVGHLIYFWYYMYTPASNDQFSLKGAILSKIQ